MSNPACQCQSCPEPATEYGFICQQHWLKVSMPTRDRVVLAMHVREHEFDQAAAKHLACFEAVKDNSDQLSLL